MDGAARRFGVRSHDAVARSGRGGGAIYALDIDTGDYYSHATAGIRASGAGAGWWVGVVFILDAIPAGSTDYIGAAGGASTDGWQLWVNTNGRVAGRGHNTGNVTTTTSGVLSADSNVVHAALLRWDTTDLQLWVDGVATDAGQAMAASDIAVGAMVLGASASGSAEFDTGKILGMAGSDNAALTDAEIAAWFADVKSSLRVRQVPGKTASLWEAYQLTDGPATLSDQIGSDDLTETGTVVVVRTDSVVAAW